MVRKFVIAALIVVGAAALVWWLQSSPAQVGSSNRVAAVDSTSATMPATIGRRITPPTDQSPNGLDGDCDDVVEGVATVNVGTLPPNAPATGPADNVFWGSDRPEMPISEEEADRLRQEALLARPSPFVQDMDSPDLKPFAPTPGVSFDSIDADDCCSSGTSTPPDPELAVGPSHIIAVVNTSFEIYNKTGTSLVGPTDFDVMFAPLDALLGGGSQCTGLFDPNVNYDEEEDRFFIGVDDGNAYCMAVSQTGNPTGMWNLYRVPTLVVPPTNLFDYPHAGIGKDAIYMGSNQFQQGVAFIEGRVWAFEKAAMYAGTAPPNVGCRSHTTGFDGMHSTPWPADIHGLPFPDGPHYIMTEVFDGANHSVWTWTDPFGTDILTEIGMVDLNAATGVTATFPVNVPQSGGNFLQANDWRGQSTHYRNGHLWMANQSISCNPGGGTVNCSRWAEIDPNGGGPSTPTVVQAGVISSNGVHRFFSSVAVDACNNMAIGYSTSSASTFAGTTVTGRLATDTPGTVQAEALMKAGERNYVSFEGSPYRWGDYTGMTIDPDGKTFWYLGEYAKNGLTSASDWGNYIGSFTFGCVPQDIIFEDGFESGNTSAWSSTVP